MNPDYGPVWANNVVHRLRADVVNETVTKSNFADRFPRKLQQNGLFYES